MPVFTFSEAEQCDNPKMRFIATLSVNKFEVGKGYGANKRVAKMTAARMALQGMVPNVFQEWVMSHGRLNALNKQNRNGVEILEQEQADLGLNLDQKLMRSPTKSSSDKFSVSDPPSAYHSSS